MKAREFFGGLAMGLAGLLVSGCLSSSRTGIPRAGTADILSTNSIPFELQDDHIFVRGTLNNRDVRYTLDTGASHVFISPELAVLSGISNTTRISIQGFGSEKGSGIESVARVMSVGPARAEVVPLIVAPLPAVMEADAVLGLSFLKQFVWRLNYQDHLLQFVSKGNCVAEKGAVIPLRVRGPRLIVEVELDGVPATLALDTGAGQTLILESWFVERQRLRAQHPNRLKILTGYGFLGPTHGEFVRLQTLKFGAFTFTNVVTELRPNSLDDSKEIAGYLGANALRCFNLTFDLPGHQLWIAANENFTRPLKPPASLQTGFACLPSGTNLIVRQVLPDSPAAQAGVHEGDRVLAIDDKPVHRMKFEEMKAPFQASPGTAVRLLLQSAGAAPRKAALILRELL